MQQCKIFFFSFIRHERYFSFILGIFFFRQVFPRKNFFPSKSVCRTYLHWNHPYPFSPQKSNGRPFTWNSLGRIRELARCKLLTLVQKLCAENCAENCPHIYVTMHQLSRQCCGPKSRRCKSSCVASLRVVLLFLVYRYRVSIQPSTGLLIALPDEAIDRLKDHLSPLNKWSLAGQCHVISLLFFTFQRFGLSVWGLIYLHWKIGNFGRCTAHCGGKISERGENPQTNNSSFFAPFGIPELFLYHRPNYAHPATLLPLYCDMPFPGN